MYKIYNLKDNWEAIEENILRHATQYIKKSGVKSLVIGLSGGIDSTVVCALARKICDALEIRLIGLSLPTAFNKVEEINNATVVGTSFCDAFYTYNIHDDAHKLLLRLTEGKNNIVRHEKTNWQAYERLKIRRGNVAARLRMIFLYHFAHENFGLVLSTDNFTELLLGFWTLHGDVGDFGMIQNLWKTEVYGLAKHLLMEEKAKNRTWRAHSLKVAIEAIPTDGLGITASDLDQIDAKSYEEVDRILIGLLNEDTSKLDHPVVQRHIKTHFKRNNPFNLRREDIIP